MGSWVGFDFNPVTRLFVWVHLKATSVGVKWQISEVFVWFHMQVITRAHPTMGYSFPSLKASRLELASHHICLRRTYYITIHMHAHRQAEKQHIVIISLPAKVVSLVSARSNGQKRSQLKSEQISGKDTVHNEPFLGKRCKAFSKTTTQAE